MDFGSCGASLTGDFAGELLFSGNDFAACVVAFFETIVAELSFSEVVVVEGFFIDASLTASLVSGISFFEEGSFTRLVGEVTVFSEEVGASFLRLVGDIAVFSGGVGVITSFAPLVTFLDGEGVGVFAGVGVCETSLLGDVCLFVGVGVIAADAFLSDIDFNASGTVVLNNLISSSLIGEEDGELKEVNEVFFKDVVVGDEVASLGTFLTDFGGSDLAGAAFPLVVSGTFSSILGINTAGLRIVLGAGGTSLFLFVMS